MYLFGDNIINQSKQRTAPGLVGKKLLQRQTYPLEYESWFDWFSTQ